MNTAQTKIKALEELFRELRDVPRPDLDPAAMADCVYVLCCGSMPEPQTEMKPEYLSPERQAREDEIEKAVQTIDDVESDFYAPIMLRVLARLFPEKSMGQITAAITLAYSEENHRT